MREFIISVVASRITEHILVTDIFIKTHQNVCTFYKKCKENYFVINITVQVLI